MDEGTSLQVLKKLEAIESLLRQLPEIMAATYLTENTMRIAATSMRGERISGLKLRRTEEQINTGGFHWTILSLRKSWRPCTGSSQEPASRGHRRLLTD